MAHEVEHVEPVAEGADLSLSPGIGVNELLRYMPLIAKVLEALETGTGSFSTKTPLGKRWVIVQDYPPEAPSR